MENIGATTLTASTPNERIIAEVGAWPGVDLQRGSRGELSIRVGRREIGHLHGDRVAHFGFPIPVWKELMAQHRVAPHPIDHPGWAEHRVENPEDVADVIDLFRLNYDRTIRRSAPDPRET